MTPGLSRDLETINDVRKTAVINNELLRLNTDIATLQETRLPSSGNIREKDFTFFWHGKAPEESSEHGVGVAVRNSLLSSISPPTKGSERILKIQINTAEGKVSIISVYAPTVSSPEEVKDRFYDDLNSIVGEVPQGESLLLLGDFNARVGADREAWPTCLGHFGIGKMNENGQRLLEFCCHHNCHEPLAKVARSVISEGRVGPWALHEHE